MRSIGVLLCLIAVVAVLAFVAEVQASERQDCHLELQAEMPNASTIVGAELLSAIVADAAHTDNSKWICNDDAFIGERSLGHGGRRDVKPSQGRAHESTADIFGRDVRVVNVGV